MADDRLARLRIEIRAAAEIEELTAQVLEVVGIIEEAVAPLDLKPVLVGGMAVYLHTADDAFLTKDIDLVMPTTRKLKAVLGALGFEKQRGRHWRLPGTEIFLEAPSADLEDHAAVVAIQSPSGREVPVLSRVDVLIERLDEFTGTGHRSSAQQALALLAGLEPHQQERMEARAKERKVDAALQGLRQLAEQITAGVRAEPDSGEWHELARQFKNAQYHQER